MKLALKIVALVFLVLVLTIGSCIGAIFWATSGVVKAGDRFVAACAAGDLAAARALGGSCDDLPRGIRDPAWDERRVANDNGDLAGVVRAPDGKLIPVHLVMKKKGGVWRIVKTDVSAAQPE